MLHYWNTRLLEILFASYPYKVVNVGKVCHDMQRKCLKLESR